MGAIVINGYVRSISDAAEHTTLCARSCRTCEILVDITTTFSRSNRPFCQEHHSYVQTATNHHNPTRDRPPRNRKNKIQFQLPLLRSFTREHSPQPQTPSSKIGKQKPPITPKDLLSSRCSPMIYLHHDMKEPALLVLSFPELPPLNPSILPQQFFGSRSSGSSKSNMIFWFRPH